MTVTFQGSPPDVNFTKLALAVIGDEHVVVIVGPVPLQTFPSSAPLPPAVEMADVHDMPWGTSQKAPLHVVPEGQVVVHGPSAKSGESTGASVELSVGMGASLFCASCVGASVGASVTVTSTASASLQLDPHVSDESMLHATSGETTGTQAKKAQRILSR